MRGYCPKIAARHVFCDRHLAIASYELALRLLNLQHNDA